MIVRLLDIPFDPIFGALMDKTRTRLGRFRFWMLLSTPVIMAAAAMIFFARPGVGVTYLWIGLLLIYAGQSMGTLSQMAWGAVLSPNYDQRSRIFGWWQAANVIGMVTILLLPTVLANMGFDKAVGFRAMGWFIVLALPVTLALAIWKVPEPQNPSRSDSAPIREYINLLKRRSVQRLLICDILLNAGPAVAGALFFFYFEDIKGFPFAQAQTLLLFYFLGAFAGGPVWMALAKRLGKHGTLICAAFMYAAIQGAVSIAPGENFWLGAAMMFFAGLPFSAGPFLLRAMMADIADEERLASGRDRTGLLYAVLTGAIKIGTASAVGAATFGVASLGYDGQLPINTGQALLGLQLFFTGLPPVLAIVAALVLVGYPLNAAKHAEIRRQLDERDLAEAAPEFGSKPRLNEDIHAPVPRPAPSPPPSDARPIDRLLHIMARLRDPEHGCPWDVEQTFATIAPYTVEEAYEVADAIERGSLSDLREELGDLLFQVVFHSRMAEEQGAFGFDDVVEAITAKMLRRHPHVFEAPDGRDAAVQTREWEAMKARERDDKVATGPRSLLDDVPIALPGLTRAAKLTRRAARVGFDWPSAREVLDKLREETAELEAEIEAGDLGKAREELGDLLFVVANLARKLDVEPEDAIRTANAKFVRRFSSIEAALAAEGRTPEDSDLAEMDALWDAAKAAERA
jgi:MazG family protein